MIFSVFIILQICKLFSVKSESNYNWILLNFLQKQSLLWGHIIDCICTLRFRLGLSWPFQKIETLQIK